MLGGMWKLAAPHRPPLSLESLCPCGGERRRQEPGVVLCPRPSSMALRQGLGSKKVLFPNSCTVTRSLASRNIQEILNYIAGENAHTCTQDGCW